MKVRLGDVAKVSAGQAAPKNFSSEGLPFIRAGHLEDLINGTQLDSLPKVSEIEANIKRLKKIPKKSILFAKSGMSATKNRVYITEKETYFVSHLAAILPNKNFDSFFLGRFLSWYNPSKLILDSAYPSIRLGDINNLKIPLPPLKTQKRIASILDDAAALRDKTKQLLTEYDLLAQSIFLEMFGDPVTNPKEWNFSTIEKVCIKISGGGTPKRSNEEYFTGNIPWVTPKDMKKLYIDNSKIKITKKAVKESSAKLIPENSILMVIRSGILKKKLPIAITTTEVTVNQDMKAFIADKNVIIPKYLMFFFLNAQNYLLGRVRAVTADNIEFSQIKTMNIPLPNLDLQNQFAEKIALIEQQKALAKQELQESEDLFNCLLQKAFKDELVS